MSAITSVHCDKPRFVKPEHDDDHAKSWPMYKNPLWYLLVPHDYLLDDKYSSKLLFMCGAGLTALAILSKARDLFDLSYTDIKLQKILRNMKIMKIIEHAKIVLETSKYHRHYLTENVHYVPYDGKITYVEKFEPDSKTTTRHSYIHGSTMIPLSPDEQKVTLGTASIDILVRWFHSQIIIGVNTYFPESLRIYPLDSVKDDADYYLETPNVNFIDYAGWQSKYTCKKPPPGHKYLVYVLTEIKDVYNHMIKYYPDINLRYLSI